MTRTTGILVCTLAVGMAWAQNPQIIQNTRSQLNTMQQNTTAASNAALGIKQADPKTSAAKPTVIPVKSSAAAVNKTTAAPAKASVVPVKASAASTKPTKTGSASVVPVKASATSTKPTKTGSAAVVPVKASAASAQPRIASASVATKSATPFKEKKSVSASSAEKIGVKQITAKKHAKPAAEHKKTVAAAPKKSPEPAAPSSSDGTVANSSEEGKGDDDAVKDAQEKKWSMSGKRDPFISPVVSHAGGSGCSTGKKCLEIGAINLRGVVHSDGGFIAVVTNSMNKAYFLRENDPVFDGYVVKITGDSIVFKETMQDRLGKSFTREVTKKITTPAV
jgi:hypothetical protein